MATIVKTGGLYEFYYPDGPIYERFSPQERKEIKDFYWKQKLEREELAMAEKKAELKKSLIFKLKIIYAIIVILIGIIIIYKKINYS